MMTEKLMWVLPLIPVAAGLCMLLVRGRRLLAAIDIAASTAILAIALVIGRQVVNVGPMSALGTLRADEVTVVFLLLIGFLALSVSDAAEDVIGVIRAGARGYVTKSISADELVEAIGRVATGDAVFSPRLAGFVLDAFSGAIDVASIDEDLDRLSVREREVLRLIARGYAYKEIAKELFISIKTVETHVSSVLRKLQLSNRHQLTRWATDRKLV